MSKPLPIFSPPPSPCLSKVLEFCVIYDQFHHILQCQHSLLYLILIVISLYLATSVMHNEESYFFDQLQKVFFGTLYSIFYKVLFGILIILCSKKYFKKNDYVPEST